MVTGRVTHLSLAARPRIVAAFEVSPDLGTAMSTLPLRALPLLLASALVPATLAAQDAAPAGVRASDGRAVVTPAIGLVTRIRFTVTDTTMMLTRPRPVGGDSKLEGRLVSYDGEYAVLDLPRGYQFTIPVSNLRQIEQRVGPGPCRRTPARRSLCTLALVGGGMAIGWFSGDKIGNTVYENGPTSATRPYAVRGALLGAIVGLAMVPTLGRDEWVTVPMPTPTPAR